MKKVGLIINPIAGIGGTVGLKGSDGIEIQHRAVELGAEPQANKRAGITMELLVPHIEKIVTCPGEMGENTAVKVGVFPEIIGSTKVGATTAEDTKQAAQGMRDLGVSIILFVGGDGTARDIHSVVGENTVVLGIPAGVKVQSAAFASNPTSAAELVRLHLIDQANYRSAEVIDLDEAAYRQGRIITQLFGYLTIPYQPYLIQGMKVESSPNEADSMNIIADEFVGRMQAGWSYLFGPGTTLRAVASRLGTRKTLLGIDIVNEQGVVALDVNEKQILTYISDNKTKIVLTPIGGQGYLLGRGNQQLSPKVIQHVGIENIIILATRQKIISLHGHPLMVDTGITEFDHKLCGYKRIVTGFREEMIYRVAC